MEFFINTDSITIINFPKQPNKMTNVIEKIVVFFVTKRYTKLTHPARFYS